MNLFYHLKHFKTIFRKLSKSQSDVNVFATDAILATLMCCTRSAYSWDIVVQKIGGKVFLDKRDNTEFGKLEFNLATLVSRDCQNYE